MSQQKLRFAIMCDSDHISHWQAVCVKRLLKNPQVELAAIIKNAEPRLRRSFFARLKRINLRRLKYYLSLWRVFEQRFLRIPALDKVRVKSVFENTPIIHCKPIHKGIYTRLFQEDDIEKIKGYNLDFALRFGFGIVRGEILNTPRYGIWSFHHDDEMKYRGAPPGFWEMYTGDRVTGSILQRLTDRLDGGIVLRKGFFSTHATSYTKHLNTLLLNTVDWPAQACNEILNDNKEIFNEPPSKSNAPIYKDPTNIQCILFVLKAILVRLKNYYRHFFLHRHWGFAVAEKSIPDLIERPHEANISWIHPKNRSEFYADPFGFVCENGLSILFEHYENRTGKGAIACALIKNNEDSNDACSFDLDCDHNILATDFHFPFHTAYPFIFNYGDGNTYCIPETALSGAVQLYKCKKAPDSWQFVQNLVEDFPAVDCTVFKYSDYWWLFCTRLDDEPNLKLFAWYSDDLFGNWHPHENNPIKTDIRSSRPAGTPFMHNGSLYRPAQNCSDDYGSGINICKINQLTPAQFNEEIVWNVDDLMKEFKLDGMHTFSNVTPELTIFDYFNYRFLPAKFKDRLKSYTNRLLRR